MCMHSTKSRIRIQLSKTVIGHVNPNLKNNLEPNQTLLLPFFQFIDYIMSSTYPFNWNPAPEALENERSKHYTKPSGLINAVVSDPLKIHMPRPMVDKNVGERVYNFKLRPDDVWIITYPKCGTTWSQEMVWQIVNKVNLDMAKIPLLVRSPFLEMEALISQKEVDMMDEKA